VLKYDSLRQPKQKTSEAPTASGYVRYMYHGTVYHGTCTMSDVHHSRGGRITHMVHVPWYSVPWYMK